MTSSRRLGFWPALGIVFVCGIVSGFALRIFAVPLFATAAAGAAFTPFYGTPGGAAGILLAFGAAGVAVTAVLVTVGVALVTEHHIGFSQALLAGVVGWIVGLVPLVALVSNPATPGAAAVGFGLGLPFGLLALGTHAWLVSVMAEA